MTVPTSVLKQVREAGQRMTRNRPHNEHIALRLLQMGARAAGWETGRAADEDDWADRVYSETVFKKKETVFDTQVRRCRVQQGVGSDGFRCMSPISGQLWTFLSMPSTVSEHERRFIKSSWTGCTCQMQPLCRPRAPELLRRQRNLGSAYCAGL